ncbi:carboxypeptidase-like regulatory domain-containing protein [Aestuariirhabdus sp. LZHN29]|uniref:carboxypeptidase-like regulatory domain-containing protein n=1 Tax=Aestuariirhabdus sp. LZHN29 TaxID=3417462 RepID=UPI003CED5188
MSKHLLALFSLSLLSFPTHAHLLKVFAYGAGERIEGSVYFAGGEPVSGAAISLFDAAGTSLAADTLSDTEGNFSLIRPSTSAHRVQASTGDGHVAQWQLASASPAPDRTVSQPAGRAGESAPNELERRVERAVARQIGPLRLELQQQASRARLSDLLGGLGTLLGIAGALLWWRSRQPR